MATAVVLVAAGLAAAAPVHAAGAAPVVNAGPDQRITVADVAFLHPTVSDDDLPAGLGRMSWTWTQVSGPGAVTIDRPGELNTVARFPAAGTYTLRLTVSDGDLSSSDDVVVNVATAHPRTLRVPQDHATIQAALNATQAYDLVLVAPGTYREHLTIPRTVTLASTYYTTRDPAMIAATVIQGTDATLETIVGSSSTGPETQLIGFTVIGGSDGMKHRGQGKVISNRFSGSTDAVEYGPGDSGWVFDNVMENQADDGVDLNDSEVLVEGNVMRNNVGEAIETRMLNHTSTVSQIIFRGNEFRANGQDGLQLIDDDTTVPTAGTMIVDRNLFLSNVQAAFGFMDNATTSEDYRAASLRERVVITNNTFVGGAYGITGGDNSVVVNNIFTGIPNIAVKGIDGGSVVAHNLFWANGTNNSGSNVDTSRTILADPLLDASYRLQSGSPARDAGTASFSLANGERVVTIAPSEFSGTAPDLGRYESSGPVGPTNARPVVNAGADASITLPTLTVALAGTATDDGLPSPPGALTVSWSQVGGPAGVAFSSGSAASTQATFPGAGTYTLRLTASDSSLSASDDVVVTVVDPVAATVLERRVAAGADDAEESASGSVSLTSSDLELVFDGSNQAVGLRFTNVTVPQGASVSRAWIQFATDEAQSEVTDLVVRAQAADDAAAFTSTVRSVSGRTFTSAQARWQPAAWATLGEAGAAQRTPDLAALVSEVVTRPGWRSGAAMAFVFTGTGHRTARAFEAGAATAPLLRIEYSSVPVANRPPVANDDTATAPAAAVTVDVPANDTDPDGNLARASVTLTVLPTRGSTVVNADGSVRYTPTGGYVGPDSFTYRICDTAGLCDTALVSVTVTGAVTGTTVLDVRVATAADDAEEASLRVSQNSDLELAVDGTRVQHVGMRFTDVTVPRGAVIERAWVQFRVDEVTTGAANLQVWAEAADSAPALGTSSGNISSRPRTTARPAWVPAAWPTIGAAGPDQRTPDLAAVIQEVVNRPGWNSGAAVLVVVAGTGTRTAEAYEGGATFAPVLHVEYRSA